MREIKFRAWDSEKKQMILPDYSDWEDFFIEPDGVVYQSFETGTYEAYRTKRQTKNLIVMQFTGLKDKNGKEIYEGDIVKMADWNIEPQFRDDDSHHRIYWDEKTGRWWDERLEDGDSLSGYQDNCIDWVVDGKVIGNIYSNPELLKP